MTNTLAVSEAGFRLVFDAKMTFAFAEKIEDMILDALRRYKKVEVDLSKVCEIDLCGSHLLGLLESFIDKGIVIIATSPIVKLAYERLHAHRCPEKPACGTRGKKVATGTQRSRHHAPTIASQRRAKLLPTI